MQLRKALLVWICVLRHGCLELLRPQGGSAVHPSAGAERSRVERTGGKALFLPSQAIPHWLHMSAPSIMIVYLLPQCHITQAPYTQTLHTHTHIHKLTFKNTDMLLNPGYTKYKQTKTDRQTHARTDTHTLVRNGSMRGV